MEYFWGPDTYAAREAIDAVAHKVSARVRFIDREHIEAQRLTDIVGQSNGLFGVDLVVLRDPSALPKSLQEDVVAAVAAGTPKHHWVLWDRVAPDKRSKLWRALKPFAREFPAPTKPELWQWLVAEARAAGGTVEPVAADMLVTRVGVDRWRLKNELARLLLMNKNLSPALIEQEVVAPEMAEIFSMLDALVRGEQERAVRAVHTLLNVGHSELYIVSMLGYQFRTLAAVRAGVDERQSAGAIARAGKLHPYVVEKSLDVARQLPYAHWRDGLTRILASDFAIKQGKVDPRTGLLMLVLTLSATR